MMTRQSEKFNLIYEDVIGRIQRQNQFLHSPDK